jgi:hypothetical protein
VNTVLLLDEQIIETIYNENIEEEEFSIPNIEAIDERGYRYDVEMEVAYKSFSFACLLYH